MNFLIIKQFFSIFRMNNEIVQIERHPAPGLDSNDRVPDMYLEQFPAVGGPGSGPGGNQLFNLYMSFNRIFNTLFHKHSGMLLNLRSMLNRAVAADENERNTHNNQNNFLFLYFLRDTKHDSESLFYFILSHKYFYVLLPTLSKLSSWRQWPYGPL